MDWLFVVLLAVAQGVAEFLPISSSGHLAIYGMWMGFDADKSLALGIVLHAGTLLSIVIFYFRELLSYLAPRRFRVAWMVILGSIPAGVVGIALKKSGLVGPIFGEPLVIGAGFLLTALLLQLSSPRGAAGHSETGTPLEEMSWKQALGVGLMQGVAIWPGLSRSGSTISAGLFAGLRRADAMRFSFLLAIPAIGGAALLELKDMLSGKETDAMPMAWPLLATGFVLSAIVGYFSLLLLLKLLRGGRLAIFSWYLYTFGALVIAWRVWQLIN